MFFINLNHVEFIAKHGVLESEKVTPQKFIVDVRIETDQVVQAAHTDHINNALNYVDVYEIIHDIMMKKQYELIETIAMKISNSIVAKYDSVVCVEVKVTKVNPPIKGYTGTVSCEYMSFGKGYIEADAYIEEDEDALKYEDQNQDVISVARL